MHVSVRSYLLAGVAAVGAVTIALPSLQVSPPDIAVDSTHTPPISTSLTELLESAQRTMDPFVTDSQRSSLPVPPSEGRSPSGIAAPAPPAPPSGRSSTPQDSTGDLLVQAYEYARQWVDWSVQSAIWATEALGWAPFVPLLGAQVDLFYEELLRPTADTLVLGFLEPVLDDPLALEVWIDSATRVLGDETETVVNFAVAQVDYFFGWATPPSPPAPPPSVTAEFTSTAVEDQPAGQSADAGPGVTPPAPSADDPHGTGVAPGGASAPQPQNSDGGAATPSVVVPQGRPDPVVEADPSEVDGDQNTAAVVKPRLRPGQRIAGGLRQAADDVRTGVRKAVDGAGEAATRIRDRLRPSRTSAGTSTDAKKDADARKDAGNAHKDTAKPTREKRNKGSDDGGSDQ